MRPLAGFYKVVYHLLLFVGEVLFRLVCPVRAIGRQHLVKGGFVLAPNHLYAIDPLFVILARGFGKKMLVLAKQELFEKNDLLNFFWSIAGAVPVDRGTGNKATVAAVMAEVGKGRGLLVFPEGTRSVDGTLGRLKSGAFVIAMEAGVPMIPCRIAYKAGRPAVFRRTTVVFGAPIFPEELGLTGEYSAKKLREAKRIFTDVLEELYAKNKEWL